MNIPNDAGWGKAAEEGGIAGVGQGNGLMGHISTVWSGLPRNSILWAILALTATFCFGLGLLAAKENGPSKDPLWIEQLPPEELPGSIATDTPAEQPTPTTPTQIPALPSKPAAAASALPQTGNYVASKTGTKYYLPTCATAKRIKDENKVWFATKQQAEAAGYQPSSTCKGL